MNRSIRSPRECSHRRAVLYAALVHLILLTVLLYGVRWKNKPSTGAEAQLWSAAEITPPAPEQRTPPPAPTPAPPAPVQSAPAQPDPAEIALERARWRQQQEALQRARWREQEKQRLRQRQLAEQAEKAAQEKKRRAQRQQQLFEQQRQQQLAEQQRREQKKAEQRKALQAQRQAAQQAKEKAQIEQQRRARLEALARAAGAATGSSGAAKSGAGEGIQGSPGYADKVRQRVKPNLVFDTQTLSGNPQTVVSVQCAPDGALLNARIVHSSGFPAWDEAVLRAVRKSDPMPRDANGRAPSRFTITFRPKD